MVAVLAVPGLPKVAVDEVSAGLAPRVPDVVRPAEPLLAPQLELLDDDVGVLAVELLELLNDLELLELLNDLELPPLLLLLDPRANASPPKATRKTKAMIREPMVRVRCSDLPFIAPS